MKKVWKIILSILLVIILATAGTIYYFLNVKTYDIADEELEEIIETDYEIILPNDVDAVEGESGNTEGSADDTAGAGTGTDGNDDTASDQGTSENNDKNQKDSDTPKSDGTTTGKNNSGTSKPNTSNQPSKKPTDSKTEELATEVTVKNIKDKYRPVFQSLESQASGKIDSLVSRAIGEYNNKKANGESISYSYFYQKYTSAGRDLESKTDAAFNYIYTALEKDLKKHGYSASHAKVFREQYNETKKDREAALLNKAKEAL
jgi:ABC-type cobalt transport system substrate-binding protein